MKFFYYLIFYSFRLLASYDKVKVGKQQTSENLLNILEASVGNEDENGF